MYGCRGDSRQKGSWRLLTRRPVFSAALLLSASSSVITSGKNAAFTTSCLVAIRLKGKVCRNASCGSGGVNPERRCSFKHNWVSMITTSAAE